MINSVSLVSENTTLNSSYHPASCINSSSFKLVKGTPGAGFIRTELPLNNCVTLLLIASQTGKFHGKMLNIVPIGSY